MDKWFYEQAQLGNVYTASPTTTGAFTVLHATSTGLTLENPYGSCKDLVIKSAKFVSVTLTTIGEVGLACNPSISTVVSTSTTSAVIHNAKNVGSNINTGVGRAYSIATLSSTPVWLEIEGNGNITGNLGGFQALTFTPNGAIIVPPGSYLTWACLTVVRNGMASFIWAEVDAS